MTVALFVGRGCDAHRAPLQGNRPFFPLCFLGSCLFFLLFMTDLLDFTGKVVLVTGSSRGIGAEMIKAFGQRGAQCVVNYISDSSGQNKSDAETVAREL